MGPSGSQISPLCARLYAWHNSAAKASASRRRDRTQAHNNSPPRSAGSLLSRGMVQMRTRVLTAVPASPPIIGKIRGGLDAKPNSSQRAKHAANGVRNWLDYRTPTEQLARVIIFTNLSNDPYHCERAPHSYGAHARLLHRRWLPASPGAADVVGQRHRDENQKHEDAGEDGQLGHLRAVLDAHEKQHH